MDTKSTKCDGLLKSLLIQCLKIMAWSPQEKKML